MPEQQPRFAGILVPVTTPFDPVTGDVAPVHFRENLRRWFDHPLDGVLLFGSTGEGILLELEEKERLIGYARDVIPADRPILAGVSAESTRSAVEQSRRLADAGADAVLVHPPVYFGSVLSPASLRDHYLALADGSPVPVLVYNMPKYTHINLEPGLVGELARHPNIAGMKDSSGDLKRFAAFAEACGGECGLLVGSGAMLYGALELGATGGIVAVGLLAPAECAALYRAYRAGDHRQAGEIQERIAPVHREIVGRLGVPGVKAALDLLGYAGGRTRPPLGELAGDERARVARVLQDAGLH
ncbi:MAG TPA: dihydrodipicolinate synthase family protein [Longimicrobiales bacterium]